jgi:hypothetical protein
MTERQVVEIAELATSFTAVCVECCELDAARGYAGATFAGRLDADLTRGFFLCRRGHTIEVVRVAEPPLAAHSAA